MKRLVIALLVVLLLGSAASLSVGNAAALQMTGGSLMTFTASSCQPTEAVTVWATDFSGNSSNAHEVNIAAAAACKGMPFTLTIVNQGKNGTTVTGMLDRNGLFRENNMDKFTSDAHTRIVLTVDGWFMNSNFSNVRA